MFPRQLDIDVGIDGFRVAASIPLTPIEEMWNALVARNALARARDADPALRPILRVRVLCVDCHAPIYHLTVIARESGPMRVCRRCGSEFSLAA
jgi:hypothetical protein